jgi:hypothetical protein
MSEYIEKRVGGKALEDELLRLIGEYNTRRPESFLVVYAGAVGKPIPDVMMTMDDYFIIDDLLRDVSSRGVDFYVETPGGFGEAAEEIARGLRKRFANVNFVVSGEAKSAGTILVLSGDDISMTKTGSLGPIDAQLQIGRTRISAFDYLEWVEEARKEAAKTDALNPFDATMIAQISPGELKLVHHSLEFAKDIVIEWLQKYKFKNWAQTETRKMPVDKSMKEKRAKEIAGILSNHARWRTHGRSLKIEDLHGIGLKINRIDDDPVLSEIVYRIQTVLRLLFSSTSTYKIFATASQKIFKNAVPTGAPPLFPAGTPAVAEVAHLDIKCQKCGKTHSIYAKFVQNPKIDEDYKNKGATPFPKDNKLVCDCGFEIDLSGIRNEIETRIGKSIV